MTAAKAEFFAIRKEFETYENIGALRNQERYEQLRKKLIETGKTLAETENDPEIMYWLAHKSLFSTQKSLLGTEGSLFGSYHALLEPGDIERLLRKASGLGHQDSTVLYARYLWAWDRQVSVKQIDRDQALELFERAASYGTQEDRYTLALILIDYDPDRKTLNRARKILRGLMKEDYFNAFYTYYKEFLFKTGALRKDPEGTFGLLKKIYEKAVLNTDEAWRPTIGEIAFHLGLCCESGFGCPKDPGKALEWMRVAQRNNDENAYYWMLNKKLIPKGAPAAAPKKYDTRKFTAKKFQTLCEEIKGWADKLDGMFWAYDYHALEAEALACAKYRADVKNDAEAMVWLCRKYGCQVQGLKVRVGLEEGEYLRYLERAAQLGNKRAAVLLAAYYWGEQPIVSITQCDQKKARDILEQAAKTGDILARESLAYYLLTTPIAGRARHKKRVEKMLRQLTEEKSYWASLALFYYYYYLTGRIRKEPQEAYAYLVKAKEYLELDPEDSRNKQENTSLISDMLRLYCAEGLSKGKISKKRKRTETLQ